MKDAGWHVLVRQFFLISCPAPLLKLVAAISVSFFLSVFSLMTLRACNAKIDLLKDSSLHISFGYSSLKALYS